MKRVFAARIMAVALLALSAGAFAPQASAQRIPVERLSARLVKMKAGEITLEAINFRDQTARLNLALDVSNGLVPVTLSDFEYSLSLGGRETISGLHDGSLKIGGRNSTRVNLPVTVHLRSIPGTVWSAFRNGGRVQYDLDTGFTLPLFVTEQRFDQRFSGEVPLRTLVDAASILRASGLAGAGGGASQSAGIWPF